MFVTCGKVSRLDSKQLHGWGLRFHRVSYLAFFYFTRLDLRYEVDSVVATRRRAGEQEVLVKWVGFSAEHNTWEPRKSLLKQGLGHLLEPSDDDEDFDPVRPRTTFKFV